MAYVDLSVETDTDNLARELADVLNYDDLIEFIMEIDARVVDIDFTRDLRDALTEVIKEEEAAA